MFGYRTQVVDVVVVGRRIQTGVDPFRASPERCPEWRDQHRRGAPDVRCTHAHTRTLALLRNRDRADIVNSPAGSQRTACPPRPVAALPRHHLPFPGGPSHQPAVPPACTCVPRVTTPRRSPELVKHPITVRSGRSTHAHQPHQPVRCPQDITSHHHNPSRTPATLIPREAWQSGRMHLS